MSSRLTLPLIGLLLLFGGRASAFATVEGHVHYSDGRPASQLTVIAYDRDWLSSDDLIGVARTDASVPCPEPGHGR